MGKVTFFQNLGEQGLIYDHYDRNRLELQSGATSTSATYIDNLTGDKIRIEGKNLSFTDSGEAAGGTFTKLRYLDADNNPFIVARELAVDAFLWWFTYGSGDDNFAGMFKYSLANKDVITGSALGDIIQAFNSADVVNGGGGSDEINGGEGNDRMAGGKGADLFHIRDLSGRDVITDFDAVGGSGRQDFLTIDDNRPFDVVKSRGNVVINFEDGARITLLDVKWSQFSVDADINLF